VGAKARALRGQTIQVRSCGQGVAIAAEHVAGMIVRQEEQEVRLAA
jgi:hypothetical protein